MLETLTLLAAPYRGMSYGVNGELVDSIRFQAQLSPSETLTVNIEMPGLMPAFPKLQIGPDSNISDRYFRTAERYDVPLLTMFCATTDVALADRGSESIYRFKLESPMSSPRIHLYRRYLYVQHCVTAYDKSAKQWKLNFTSTQTKTGPRDMAELIPSDIHERIRAWVKGLSETTMLLSFMKG